MSVAASRCLAAAVVLASTGCAAGMGSPCHGAGCPSGAECLAHRCAPQGSLPVEPKTERIVMAPIRMAVVNSESGTSALPAVVSLGARIDGDVRWFLAFDETWKTRGEVERAFLLLDPAPGDGATDDIELTVWTVRSPWQAHELEWSPYPSFGLPRAPGLARSQPSAPLRVDVTAIAKRLASSNRDHGMVVIADDTAGHGAPYWTGTLGGMPPRLEVYLR